MPPSTGATRWDRIRALFDELVDLDVGERAKRLHSLGVSDPALRNAVEALLAADAAADAELASIEAPFRPAPDPLGLSGRTLSHFHIQALVGAGGMGVVYRAEDTRLGRPVALKFLLPAQSFDDSAKSRFLHEARSAAALDHANLCTVHEVGEDEEGRMFFAMTLYAGETLKARLEREGQLPVADAVAIARQIASGLACAHAAGIVHRDLKPGNVMLLPDGTVKVLDFGLAKARDLSLTTRGVQPGTPGYMAPEQILGERVNGRADLWALGVLLYEMLTGKRPFDGEHEIAVATAIVNRAPMPPCALRADVPAALERLVLTLLEKDPAQRVSDAPAVIASLGGAPLEIAVSKRGRTGAKRTAPGLIGVIGVIGIIIVGGLTMRESLRSDAGESFAERSVAVLPFDNLSTANEGRLLASGLHDAVITQLSMVNDLRPISRQSVLAYSGSTKTVRQIGEELDVETVLQATVQQVGQRVRVNAQLVDTRADRHLWASQFEREGSDLFALENDIALAIVEALRAEITAEERARLTRVPTRSADAYTFYVRGREYQLRPPGSGSNIFATSPEETRAAASLFRRALEIDPDFALAHARLAQVSGRLEDKRAEAEAALRLQPGLPEAHMAMSAYWVATGDLARALAEIEVARRGLPNEGEIRETQAGLLRRAGRWDEALAGYQHAFRLDPRQPAIAMQLAFTYASLRRYGDAARTWDRAFDLAPDNYRYLVEKGRVFVRGYGITDSLAEALRRVPPGFDPAGHTSLARVDLEWLRRRPREALLAFQTMRPEVFGKDDYINAAWLYMVRAWVYEELVDSTAARKDYESARVLLEGAPARDAKRPRRHAVLGMVYAGLGRKAEAIQAARLGMDLVPVATDAMGAPLMMHHAAITYMRVGDPDAAIELLERLSTMPNYLGLSVPELRLDPLWDALRSHPRFRRLVERDGHR